MLFRSIYVDLTESSEARLKLRAQLGTGSVQAGSAKVKLKFGDGKLFAGLGSKDRVCKEFDSACQTLGLPDLVIKDLRRTFINRNKYCVAHVDMVHVVGQSTLLDSANLTRSEIAVRDAVGHKNISTTAGYTNPHLEELSRVFTNTSRWPRIAGQLSHEHHDARSTVPEDVSALQALLNDTLARLSLATSGA